MILYLIALREARRQYDQCFQNSEEEWYPVKILENKDISDMQLFRTFTTHACFLIRLLENVFQQNEGKHQDKKDKESSN